MEDHYRIFAWAGLVCAAVSAFFLIRNGAASTTAISLTVPPAAAAIAVLAGHKRPVCFAAGALFLIFSFVFGRLNSPDINFQLLFPSVYSTFPGSLLGITLIVYSLKQRLPYIGVMTLVFTVAELTGLYISWLTGRIAPDVARRFFPVYWPLFLVEAADVLLAFAIQFLPDAVTVIGHSDKKEESK